MSPKISVIVAIYNVEQYIEKCAISLFNQTLEDIEYIVVRITALRYSNLLSTDILIEQSQLKS